MKTLSSVCAYSMSWALAGMTSGWIAHKVPVSWIMRDTWITRIRPFELRGRVYDRFFGVRRWKDRLPEAGGWLAGGWAKDRIRSFASEDLERLAAETRRAEMVHLSNVMFGATFLAWTEPTVGVIMVVFGAAVHLPFVVVQRYNRARLQHVLSTPRRRLELGRGSTTPADAR